MARHQGHGRAVAPPGGDHHVGGPPVPTAGAQVEAAVRGDELLERGLLLDRSGRSAGVVLEVGGHLAAGHEAVDVGPAVRPAGQPGHPVRSEQPQRVPPLAAPPLGDPAALEHDVLEPAVGQGAAHGETGLAGADDDGVDAAHDEPLFRKAKRTGGQPASTSMATGTPLVTTSYTAERFRDCSTTARSFSGSSPRSLKLTLIC